MQQALCNHGVLFSEIMFTDSFLASIVQWFRSSRQTCTSEKMFTAKNLCLQSFFLQLLRLRFFCCRILNLVACRLNLWFLNSFNEVYRIEWEIVMHAACLFLVEIFSFYIIRCDSRLTDLRVRVCVIQLVFQLFILELCLSRCVSSFVRNYGLYVCGHGLTVSGSGLSVCSYGSSECSYMIWVSVVML